MTDFSGSYTAPPGSTIPGSWTILGWNQVVVTINKLPIKNLQTVEVVKEIETGVGTCTITAGDPGLMNYNLFQALDEIEVFFSFVNSSGVVVGRKVWGGYMDTPSLDLSQGQVYQITGKAYETRLQSVLTNNTFSGVDLGSAITTVLGNQNDFSHENVPSSMGVEVSMAFTNQTAYDAIKAMCDQYLAFFYVDAGTRDVNARFYSTLVYTTDEITQGVNVLTSSSVQQNAEYLTNNLVVQGTTGNTATATNAASQAAYGTYSIAVTAGTVNSTAAAQNMATNVVNSRNAPVEIYTIGCALLPYTDPGDYIAVNVPSLGLNSTSVGGYQVMQITHNWSITKGFVSTVILNSQYIDSRIYISDLDRRMKTIEKTVYG